MSESFGPVKGSCVCGAVTWQAEGPALAFQLCHCSRCRKGSGAMAAANLFVAKEHLRFLSGEELVRRFDLPTAKYWSRCFCERCGSTLPWLSRTGKAWIVPAGGLDEDPGLRPTRKIYYGSRAEWLDVADDIEVHDTFPPR